MEDKKDIKINAFIDRMKNWKSEFEFMRSILLETELKEEMKWGQPCYTWNGKNIVILQGFKAYCAIAFFKGVLLKDEQHLLIAPTENVQEARQIRFVNLEQIKDIESLIKEYVKEAIEIEQKGLKVTLKKTSDYSVPEEFQVRLNQDEDLRLAFESLTPGRQRGYLFYFSQAKQSKTREQRIEKYIPKILEGHGLDD